MQFRIGKTELKTALDNVSKAVAQKCEIKTLEGVLFQLNQNELKLTGYDLIQGITTIVSAESMEEGSFIVQPKLLSSMVAKMSKGEIDFSLNEDMSTLTIQGGKTKFTLQVQNSIEYPNTPNLDNSNAISLSQSILKSMISQTNFAVATNDTKPILTGELFEIDKNILNVVAVDGYRLAVRTEHIKANDMKIVIPASALKKVMELLNEKSETPCQMYINHKHVTFQVGDYIIFSRVLEGEFHNYKISIPKSNNTEVVVNCKDLINSFERCLLLVNERIKSPVRCKFENGQVNISLNTEIGKINDVITAEVIGPTIEIGFNARYFLDALKATDCDKVKLLMNGSNMPMTVKPLDNDSFTFLVLPVRLKGNE